MLRPVRNAQVVRRLTLLGRRYELLVGERALGVAWGARRYAALREAQLVAPVCVAELEGRSYWIFEGAWHWADEDLAPADVLALVRERERRRRRALERAHASLAADTESQLRRQPIPREVRLAVFERDRGRCVQCGAAFELQFDHVIPVALGGASTAENLQVLCATCNRAKGASPA
jgi:HNH endonuclease